MAYRIQSVYPNFNSHAHVERDCAWRRALKTYGHFNSHAHVERDSAAVKGFYRGLISTHTLTWSVTGMEDTADEPVDISTHTLTWSVTR